MCFVVIYYKVDEQAISGYILTINMIFRIKRIQKGFEDLHILTV